MKLVPTVVQPRFSDFDMLGHLNNTAYATYAEVATEDVLANQLGGDPMVNTVMSRNLQISYIRSINYGTPIVILSEIRNISNISFDLVHTFVHAHDHSKVFAIVTRDSIWVDVASKRPTRVADFIKAASFFENEKSN